MGDVLDTAGDISGILADIERRRAEGRVAEAGVNQNQANAGANIYRTQSAVALAGPEQSARAAALGDTMANIQPFSWTGDTKMSGNIPVPQSTGGLTPANFGPATRRAGADLATLSANRVSSPAFNLPKPPVLAPLPNASGLDSILGHASTIGSLAGALGKNGGSIDLGKIIASLRNRGGGGAPGNTGQPTGDFLDNLNDPYTGGDYGPPTPPAGSTSGSASAGGQPLPGVGDGNGYYDENGNYIDLTDYANGAGNDGPTGTYWGDE